VRPGDMQEVVSAAKAEERTKAYLRFYDELYKKRREQGHRPPSTRGRRRIQTFCRAIGSHKKLILELGCGVGHLTYALAAVAATAIGTDISRQALSTARRRARPWSREKGERGRIAFTQMTCTDMAFPDAIFDVVVSTSMIEHLHRDDIRRHLHEVWRVLKPDGLYLIWCPNRLGHHDERDFHISMFSYGELMGEIGQVGRWQFESYLFNRFPLRIDARWKVYLENFLSKWKISVLWSHLGVRNVFLLARKRR
jgi:SAM-dependent methyltransferase